jgi:HD-GYP domain-containing protein (c-di-GMP phosphodiesterase class II)
MGFADVVEAMSIRRPYRPALGIEAGLTEISRKGGNLRPTSRKSAQLQSIIFKNALTFLDEVNDSEQLAFDLEWIKAFPWPALLTTGG